MAITNISDTQTYTARISSEALTATSVKDLSDTLASLTGSSIKKPIQQTDPYYGTIIYDEATKSYTVNGVPDKYGMGAILSSSGLKLNLTNNQYQRLLSVTNKIPTPVDLTNYNQWIREQYQISTGNFDIAHATKTGQQLVRDEVKTPITLLSEVKPKTRQIGQVIINSNYELEFAGPLDARLVTLSEETLVDPAWWLTVHKRPVYFYTGMPVTVESTGQLFIYMGYNSFIKKNDVSSKYMLSLKFWKRASFEIQDIIDSGVVIPATKVAGKVNIQTHRISSWTDTGGMFMSTGVDPSYGIGLTMADHMTMLGVSIDHNKKKYSFQRTILDGYNRTDAFTGLTIVPALQDEKWDANTFKQNAEGVELSGINVPILLRTTQYEDNFTKITPGKSTKIRMNSGEVLVSADECISLNSESIYLSENTAFNIGGSIKAEIENNVNTSVGGIATLTANNRVINAKNGLYVGVGDETNIITGALAVHTTGYNKALALERGALLLEPVMFDFRKSYTSDQKRYIGEAETIDTGITSRTVPGVDDGISTLADEPADTSTETATPVKGIKGQLSCYYPGLTMARSRTLISDTGTTGAANNVSYGFYNSALYGVAPGAQLSAFGTTHTSNLRVSKDLLHEFAVEVGTHEDQSVAMTIIDLSDTDNFTNSKLLTVYDASAYVTAVKDKFGTSSAEVADITKNNITVLNLQNQVWIDKDNAVSWAHDVNGNPLTIDKGYMLLGSASKLEKQEAQAFSDLINTGTVSIESFGDTSIYSHYGQVKLGKDALVRLTRDHKFIVNSAGKDKSYIEHTPDHTTICNMGAVTSSDGTQEPGHISLKSNKICLWGEEYELTKPESTEVYLTYDPPRGVDNKIIEDSKLSKALTWKSIAASGYTRNTEDFTNCYNSEYNKDSRNSRLFYYCIGEIVIPDNDNTTATPTKLFGLNLWIYISSFYWIGDIQLSIHARAAARTEYKDKPWSQAIPLSITGSINTRQRQTILETVAADAFPIGITMHYDAELHLTRLRFYTSHYDGGLSNTQPLLWFVHNIESFKGTLIDWNNTPAQGIVYAQKQSNGKLVDDTDQPIMGMYMYNSFNTVQGSDGTFFNPQYRKAPVIPLTCITDTGQIVWERYSTEAVDCPVRCSFTSPLQVSINPYFPPKDFSDHVVDDGDASDKEQTHILAYTKKDNEPEHGRAFKWVTLDELNITSGSGGSGSGSTSGGTAKLKVDALAKMTNKTGRKSTKHYVLSFDYFRNGDLGPADGTIDTSVATHESVYYDDSGDLHATNFFSSSDERLKNTINDLVVTKPLPNLKSFKFNHQDTLTYGVIAQDLVKAGYEELISIDDSRIPDKDKGPYLRVNYNSLYALYIKDLQDQITMLKSEIEALKHR